MKEFIECAKIHEIFSHVFSAFGVNPRRITDITSLYYGNTPSVSVQGYDSSSMQTIPKFLSLVALEDSPRTVEVRNESLRSFILGLRVKRVVSIPEFFNSHRFTNFN